MVKFPEKVLLATAALCVITSGVCIAQDTSTIILGGTGQAPHIQTVIDGVSDALTSSGVKVKVESGDSKSRSAILDEMKTSGNSILLYLTVNTMRGQRGKLLAESFVDGKKIWEEEVRGSLMAVSAEGEVQGMTKSLIEKLRKRIGGPGLPK